MNRRVNKIFFGSALLALALWLAGGVLETVEARAGGGRSVGSRGFRSSSPPRPAFTPPPSRPAPTPSPTLTPRPQPTPGMATPTPQPASGGFWRSLAGGLAGGLLGGMIGNLLFGGAGHAGPAGATGSGCANISLLDLLIIGGLIYLGYRLLRGRRQEPLYATGGPSAAPLPTSWSTPEPPMLAGAGVAEELAELQRQDPAFDPERFKEYAQDVFFKVQGAWTRQDLSSVRDLLTPELYQILAEQLAEQKTAGRINRLENIAVRQVEISEAWQEGSQQYLTVGLIANLLDYTVDAKSGAVVEGSDREPVKFEEYWTFVRPLAGGAWRLSAITQPEG